MPPIWERADCQLSADTVAALIDEQAGRLEISRLRFLDEGWSSWAYLATDGDGNDWIFRFPKRRDVALRLQRELAILPLLHHRLPLPIPRFEVVGRPGDRYPHPFTGYRMLAGTPALERLEEPLDLAEAGRVAGTFLAALHDSPTEWERHAPAIEDDPGDESPEEAVASALAKLEAFGAGLPRRVRSAAAAALARPAPPTPARVLLHADFFPEHVLVNEGRLVGVIDWGDMDFGDPAEDLAGLYYWHGEALLSAGIAAYGDQRGLGRAACEDLARRARTLCLFRAVDDLEYGSLAARPEYFGVAVRFLERFAAEV